MKPTILSPPSPYFCIVVYPVDEGQGGDMTPYWENMKGERRRIPDGAPLLPAMNGDVVERVREWALDKAATHHRLAGANEHLRTEHVASSAAYYNLADEIASLLGSLDEKGPAQSSRRGDGETRDEAM